MKKFCKQCGKEFLTEYPTKLYCSLKCANAAYFEREESDYKYLPETAEPFFIFNCAECGKEVKIYSKYDQRHTYCCGSGAITLGALNRLLELGINPNYQSLVTFN